MQEFESGDDFGRVKPGSILLEATALLNVEHQIAPVQILHHKEQVRLPPQKNTNRTGKTR